MSQKSSKMIFFVILLQVRVIFHFSLDFVSIALTVFVEISH